VSSKTQTGRVHPKVVVLGGDHSISLPIIRALNKTYGPVSAIHIDAHIDTWSPSVYAGSKGIPSEQSKYSDGTPYYHAGLEGLLTDTCVHAGIRSTLKSAEDMVTDAKAGFTTIPAYDILKVGPEGIAAKILKVVPHDKPVYVSLDVDVLDPSFAPGTAGPSAGGWTSREVIQIIIDGLSGLDIVGVDVVEVLPALDSPGDITAVTASEMTFELITTMVKNGLMKKKTGEGEL